MVFVLLRKFLRIIILPENRFLHPLPQNPAKRCERFPALSAIKTCSGIGLTAAFTVIEAFFTADGTSVLTKRKYEYNNTIK
jgi:hypothetical protein